MENIKSAVSQVRALEGVRRVSRTSFLYESPPALVQEQPNFLNGVIEIETKLDPYSLITSLQGIEDHMLRDRSQIRYGPRVIDLDVLIYQDGTIISDPPTLTLPHDQLINRPFVLQPLHDLCPELEIPGKNMRVDEALTLLKETEDYKGLRRVLPWIGGGVVDMTDRTLIMGILNCTPDSFSDGGKYIDPDIAVSHAKKMVQDGADILDIGGQSTRPGAAMVTAKEETERVVPVINRIRSDPFFDQIPISIDTFRHEVALNAVEAGANIINDVSGGRLDEYNMFKVVAELDVPYILMHMRGDPNTMQSEQNTKYNDVVETVSKELCEQIDIAEKMGIPRWNIIIDPGIGFAKKAPESLKLLQDLPRLQKLCGDFPVLSGPSRKSFIEYAFSQRFDASDSDSHKDLHPRVFGTAAAVTASVLGGAKILRVHDVREMRDVVAVSDEIYRA
ncbi:hypothetical protein AAMO2058_001337900 [Amorphochlora amoebiformis]